MRRELFALVAGALTLTTMAPLAFAQDQPSNNVTVTAPPAAQPTVVEQPPPAPSQDKVVVVPTPQQAAASENESYTVANSSVITSGVVTFGISYGVAAIAAASSDRDSNKRMYVPLLGPWLAMADRGDCPVAESRCDHETRDKVLMAVDGVFQAAGVITAVYGVLTPVTVVHSRNSAKIDAHVIPVSMGQGSSAGLGVVGTF